MMNQKEMEALISIRMNLHFGGGKRKFLACPLPAEGCPPGCVSDPWRSTGGEGKSPGGEEVRGDRSRSWVWRGCGKSIKRFVNNLGKLSSCFLGGTFKLSVIFNNPQGMALLELVSSGLFFFFLFPFLLSSFLFPPI